MTKALMAVDFLKDQEEVHRPAMNPASVIWPEWRDYTVTAMLPRSKKWRDDQPVVVLNKGWKPTL